MKCLDTDKKMATRTLGLSSDQLLLVDVYLNRIEDDQKNHIFEFKQHAKDYLSLKAKVSSEKGDQLL
jgi:hypothetical protein